MKIEQSTHSTGDVHEFRDEALTCTNCHTNKDLIIEALHPALSRTAGLVAIEYSCGNCEAYFAYDAPVEDVAKLLGKHFGIG